MELTRPKFYEKYGLKEDDEELMNDEVNLLEYRKEVFQDWIRDQIDNWLCEYGGWDYMIEDDCYDFDEDDWEFIKNNLKVTEIVIEEK